MLTITLADTPAGPERGLKSLSRVEVLNHLALEASALLGHAQAPPHTSISAPTSASFSISDFLVPGLQTRTWEDWQVADELNPFVSDMDRQDVSSDLASMQFQMGLDGMLAGTMWDSSAALGLSTDQAYDEFVFDLAPSNFETPATVNIADLIVGPDSMAPSVSPLDLAMPTMPASFHMEQDLALADLYGFTDSSLSSNSDSGSDLSDAEPSSDEEEDETDDGDQNQTLQDDPRLAVNGSVDTDPTVQKCAKTTMSLDSLDMPHVTDPSLGPMPEQQQQTAAEDPNKRRMEEALVARISNDLGPEHMAGLFEILKGSGGQSALDEDEEMEVDLSSLDETTLVEVYQYVETCCMQTLGSILAAEEQKRITVQKQAMEQRMAACMSKTPELSPSHSSSSCSPSPPHPSSFGSNNNNRRRHATGATSCASYYDRHDVEEQAQALWMTSQHKYKRKRGNKNGPVCMGGGGTGKGQRIPMMTEAEEDNEEIDIMGI
ncbi:hypothetical protein BGZ70_008243 [Mortierella alpina]|uniref:NET domain-containing protein n=1 Tax=Mortierella alpina TaxID=64518 RepID=A0A9P6J4I0_MORAP|nr:hypothetical protein BGZ70_008243 [Mortierella alpina]